ncbi:MAG: response regulator [Chitinophagaceae bacterium]
MVNDQKTILCIEDDPDDMFLIRESISRLSDITIECAKNGQEALDTLGDRKISKRLPSLIVIDISLPKLNGNKVIKAIQEDDDLKNIPVVVFTTSINSFTYPLAEDRPIEVIAKPTGWKSYEGIAKRLLNFVS